MIDSGLSERGTTRVDAQGTPTQCHASPSILVYEDKTATDSDSTTPGEGSARAGEGEAAPRQARQAPQGEPPTFNLTQCIY